MVQTLTAQDVIEKCNALKGNWSRRNQKMLTWYSQLLLTDTNTDTEMESVVSNDPRTGYNLALHLLTSGVVNHKVDIGGFSKEQITAAAGVESYILNQWNSVNRRHMSSGRQSWNRELFSMMLAFGWYAVLAPINDSSNTPRCEAVIWHPADVYAEFTEDGLSQVAHIYSITSNAANFKARKMGWKLTQPFAGASVTIYDYHYIDEEGYPSNTIVMGGIMVKPPTQDRRFDRLPVFVSPVGGLPDTGTISTGQTWQDHYGEALVATNEGMTNNYNKLLTFSQQLLRDTANPRWYEKITGQTHILKQEDMFKRGAVFSMSVNEDIGTVPMPVIPIELRSSVFDYQAMLQRGSFPYLMYGNIQQQITGYTVEQMASAALQALTPYHDAFVGLMTDIDTFWAQPLVSKTISMPDFDVETKSLIAPITINVSHNVKIPGLDIQRAQMAKTLDPNFRLSTETVIGMAYPEIRDATREIARAHRDDAMATSEAISLIQISAYLDEANALKVAGDSKMAGLYNTLANNLLQKISGQGQKSAAEGNTLTPPQQPFQRSQTQQQPPTNVVE